MEPKSWEKARLSNNLNIHQTNQTVQAALVWKDLKLFQGLILLLVFFQFLIQGLSIWKTFFTVHTSASGTYHITQTTTMLGNRRLEMDDSGFNKRHILPTAIRTRDYKTEPFHEPNKPNTTELVHWGTLKLTRLGAQNRIPSITVQGTCKRTLDSALINWFLLSKFCPRLSHLPIKET